MKRSSARKAALLVPMLMLSSAYPVVRYRIADQEKAALGPDARKKAPGAFAFLSAGTTHYQAAGPPDGRAVLLICGFSTPFNVWDPTFDALAKAGFRVVRYDLFGRGYSDRPAGNYDANLYDQQALDLIDWLGIREVDVAGVSMGGPIAVTFAVRHPGRARRVLLFDPGYFDGSRVPWNLRAPVIGEYQMAVSIAPRLPQAQWADFIHPERHPHYLDPYLQQMRYRGFRRALLQTLRNYVSTDVTADFRALGQSGKPVLLVWGRADRDTPPALSEKVRAAIPQAEFHLIENAAHIPHYERPEVVNPIVTAFLAHD